MTDKQIRFTAQSLMEHEFCQKVLLDAMDIKNKGKSFLEKDAGYDLTEQEFYTFNVFYTLHDLLMLCEQLENGVLFLSSFSPSKKMKDLGVTRWSQLHYNIENYLIRTRSISDRVLKLCNCVFNLGIDRRQCKFHIITTHKKIAEKDIVTEIKKINGIIDKYKQKRDNIIHHSSYRDDMELNELGLFHLVLSGKIKPPKEDNKFLSEIARVSKRITKKVVDKNTEEFQAFNISLFEKINKLLVLSDVQYQQEAKLIAISQIISSGKSLRNLVSKKPKDPDISDAEQTKCANLLFNKENQDLTNFIIEFFTISADKIIIKLITSPTFDDFIYAVNGYNIKAKTDIEINEFPEKKWTKKTIQEGDKTEEPSYTGITSLGDILLNDKALKNLRTTYNNFKIKLNAIK